MRQDARWTRRDFLRHAVAATFPLLLPPRVALAQGGAPSGNVVTAHVGLGPVGRKYLRARERGIAAVCDVDQDRLYAGASLAGPGVEIYSDYRRILDRNDIDAVVIATPDHWHAAMAIEAIQAGKDVFIEAPVSRTLGEGLGLAHTGRYHGAVVHVGGSAATREPSPGEGEASTLGGEAEVWAPGNPGGGDPAADAAPPESLDWQAWLGPHMDFPYNPDRLNGGDRWIMALGGGMIRQQGASLFGWALDAWRLNNPDTVEVYTEGLPQRGGLWDCPATLRANCSFPGSNHVFRWSQDSNRDESGMRLTRGDNVINIAGAHAEMQVDGNPTVTAENAMQSWLRAIQQRATDPDALDRAVLAASLGTLANLSFRLGRNLVWKPDAGRFVDDAIANRMIEESA